MYKNFFAGVLALTLTAGTLALPASENYESFDIYAKADEENEGSSEWAAYGDFLYDVLDNDTIRIVSYNGDSENVTIPAQINGKKVTTLGAEAFSGNSVLKSVTIPKNITAFENNVFDGCSNLTDIYYESSKNDWAKITGSKDYGFTVNYYANHTHSYTTVVKTVKPTYFSGGYTIKKCECGKTITTNKTSKKTLGKVSKIYYSSTLNTVKLKWSKVKDANGYIVYKYDPKTYSLKKIATVKSNTYTAKKLKGNYIYGYVVKAYKKSGSKVAYGQSNYKITYTKKLGKVSKIYYSSTLNSVKLKWTKVKGASGYVIYKYNPNTNKLKKLTVTSKNTKTFKNLKTASAYAFVVMPYNKTAGGTSYGMPNVIKTYTKLGKPVFTSVRKNHKIILKWKKVKGAQCYKIYIKTSANGKYRLIKNTKATSYVIKNTDNAKKYYIKIISYKKVTSYS